MRVHLQVTVILFMINVLNNPQTTCKLPANVNSGLPNAVNNEIKRCLRGMKNANLAKLNIPDVVLA
jgi:hypothetical protein